MIEFSELGVSTMLAAVRQAAREVALRVGDSAEEPKNERYARVKVSPEAWGQDVGQLVGREAVFYFSSAVGMVTGYAVLDSSGSELFSERFDKAYNFSEYGGRLRVVPVITLKTKKE